MAEGTRNPDYDPGSGDYVGGDDGTNAYVVKPPPPPPSSSSGSGYGSPGPGYSPSLSKQMSNAVNDPNSIFDAYPGPAVDAAKTILKNFNAMMGWPTGFDSNQAALLLLQSNLESQPGDAYEKLYWSSLMSDDQRKSNPWARFGMDADTYHQNLTSASDMIKNLTGMDVGMDINATDAAGTLLQNIVRYGWTQAEVLDAFQSGSFTDIKGDKQDISAIVAAQPWLASGQTYQQQAQQYSSIYGAPPVDTKTLAGWYRFNRSASQMGPWYQPRTTEQAAKAPQQSEVR